MILRKLRTFAKSNEKLSLLYDVLFTQRRKNRLERKIKEEASNLVFGINPNIVVSLTSFSARFEKLPLTLKSLLNQSVKPDKIIVWLDDNAKITYELQALQKYGITFRWKKEVIKPHKKYFYAMQEFSDSIIITVDDDLIYPPDLIKSLLKTWRKFPDCVCARRVHKITFDTQGRLNPYNDWILEYKKINEPSHELCATGVGGVLYPPHIFDEKVFNIDAINKFCLEADDIWLKWHELRLGVKVVWAKNSMVHPPVVLGSQSVALSKKNVQESKNDNFIENCQKEIFELTQERLDNL